MEPFFQLLFYRAALPLSPNPTYIAGIIRRHRTRIGPARRELNPGSRLRWSCSTCVIVDPRAARGPEAALRDAGGERGSIITADDQQPRA
jgi:hypothetical protein